MLANFRELKDLKLVGNFISPIDHMMSGGSELTVDYSQRERDYLKFTICLLFQSIVQGNRLGPMGFFYKSGRYVPFRSRTLSEMERLNQRVWGLGAKGEILVCRCLGETICRGFAYPPPSSASCHPITIPAFEGYKLVAFQKLVAIQNKVVT